MNHELSASPAGRRAGVVFKDVGGYVDQYDRQTALYFQTNREVRLHECRSACTLALALPNVCVYPDSQLQFHKAYNPETRDANDGVSDAMMAAYPSPCAALGRSPAITSADRLRTDPPRRSRLQCAAAAARDWSRAPELKDNPPENPFLQRFRRPRRRPDAASSLATVAQVRMASVRPVSVKSAPRRNGAAGSGSATAVAPKRRAEPSASARRRRRPDERAAARGSRRRPTPSPRRRRRDPTNFWPKPAAVAPVAPPSNWGRLHQGLGAGARDPRASPPIPIGWPAEAKFQNRLSCTPPPCGRTKRSVRSRIFCVLKPILSQAISKRRPIIQA